MPYDLGHTRPRPRAACIVALSVYGGKKFGNVGGELTVAALKHASHRLHVFRAGGDILVGMPFEG